MAKNNFQIAEMLTYEQVFSGKPLSTANYVQKIGRMKVLILCSYFVNLDILSLQKDPLKFVYDFFVKENQDFADKFASLLLAKFGSQVGSTPFSTLNFINEIALYYIIEVALTASDSNGQEIEIIAEDQIEFMRMFLAVNSIIVNRQESLYQNKMDNIADAIPIMTACQIADYDYSQQNLIEVCLAQLFKCVYFFQFSEKELPIHLQLFNKNYGVNSWKDYIRCLCSLIIPTIKDNIGGYIVIPSDIEDYEQVVTIFDNLSCKKFDADEDYDFINLRQHPLYKMQDGSYMILSKLFLIEKLYKGLYFEFKEINDSLVGQEMYIKNLRSFIGEKFSEEYLCNYILNKCFPKRFVKKSGADFRAEGIKNSEPDYYVRNKNKVFLFECKDALFSSAIKISYDTQKVTEEIQRKLFFTIEKGKEKRKAIRQLLFNSHRLIQGSIIDDDIKKDFVRIYPIIVTHDRAFSAPGTNWIVNKWFEQELQSNYSDVKKYISPITIINIDAFILSFLHLQSRRFVLEHKIEEFSSLLKNDKELGQKSFVDYFHGQLFDKGLDFDKQLEDLKCLTL